MHGDGGQQAFASLTTKGWLQACLPLMWIHLSTRSGFDHHINGILILRASQNKAKDAFSAAAFGSVSANIVYISIN